MSVGIIIIFGSYSRNVTSLRHTASLRFTSRTSKRTLASRIITGHAQSENIMNWPVKTLQGISQSMAWPQGRRESIRHQSRTTPASKEVRLHRPNLMRTKRLRVGGRIFLALEEWSRVVQQMTLLSCLKTRNGQRNRLSLKGRRRKLTIERSLFLKKKIQKTTRSPMTMSLTSIFSPMIN